jgi:kynureninase
MKPNKADYSRFLAGHEGWLHLCAHSHHFWPDATREAHLAAWDDAARLSDRKWERVLGEILPSVQRSLAAHLGIKYAERISFAASTHEHYLRLLSCFETSKGPVRVLSTDSEFHSFRRQSLRAQESGDLQLTLVAQEPRASFAERFLQAARSGNFDIIFVSHVFFNSGGVLPGELDLLKELRGHCAMLVLDAYHSFMARPFSLAGLEDDLYVVGGGYKYLQAGEGACFLYTPPKAEALRPRNTGWYAHFASLAGPPTARTEYGAGAWRFWGSTFDPSSLYRLQALFSFLAARGLDAAALHAHSLSLQEGCLELMRKRSLAGTFAALSEAAQQVLPATERGNFLSFRLQPGQAKTLETALAARRVLCDSRESAKESYLRLGWGAYHDEADLRRFEAALAP